VEFRARAESWDRDGHPAGGLLRQESLEEARSLQDRNAAERRLVDESRYVERQENETNRLLKWVFLAFAVVAISGWVVSYMNYTSKTQLEHQKAEAETKRSRELADFESYKAKEATIKEKLAETAKKDAESARDELAKKNSELDVKNKELAATILQIRAFNEQRLASEAQKKVNASRVVNRSIVSAALARDPELKGQWRLWKNGAVLHVRFLDGEDNLKNLVKKYSQEWTQHANLKFVFDSTTDASQIRITFTQPGSWSSLGTDALTRGADESTMNLGQIRGSPSEQDAARVIRHEFGHVMGLIHEHQSPNAQIKWNLKSVYDYYGGPPNNWPKSLIDETILRETPKFEHPEYRPFDRDSIMMFPIPAGLADIVVGWNTVLSEGDKLFVSELYPRKGEGPH
jgi:hypothetical protein